MQKVLVAGLLLLVGLVGILAWYYFDMNQEDDQIRIGVTIYQMEDPFIAQIPLYIEKIAKEHERRTAFGSM